MFYDSLQKKLKKMEERNPSLNDHHQSIGKGLRDTIYFFIRYLAGDVEYVQKWTWESLGVANLVEEHREYEGRPIILHSPPPDVVKRTIEATIRQDNEPTYTNSNYK